MEVSEINLKARKSKGFVQFSPRKAKRLSRSRKGLLFNKPAGIPIRVMGMQWTAALITGLEGIPKIALMSWWTTKGDYEVKLREQEENLLRISVKRWGSLLTHVFDRGYASGRGTRTTENIARKICDQMGEKA